MNKNRTAIFEIHFPSVDSANMVYRALKPESGTATEIETEDKIITLTFKAETTAMLRALTNSYLRWIILIKQVSSALS